MNIKIFSKYENKIKKIEIFWHFVLYLSFISMIISGVYGFLLFKKINKNTDVFMSGNNANQVETIKKEKIENTLNFFTEREAKAKLILENPVSVIDPSL